MKKIMKAATFAATLATMIAFGAMIASQASAAEFCRTDVSGHMTGCGFDSMAQCQAASAGIGGDCFRDPWLKDIKNAQQDSRNAYAYHPKSSRARRGSRTAGSAANTGQ